MQFFSFFVFICGKISIPEYALYYIILYRKLPGMYSYFYVFKAAIAASMFFKPGQAAADLMGAFATFQKHWLIA